MISEIDYLLAKYVEKHITDNLSPDTIKKIKNRLTEQGYSFLEAIYHFYPFYNVLEEFFGAGSIGMLQKIFRNIYEIKKTTNNITLVIKDSTFSNLILNTYGNNDKKSILQTIANSSMSISNILDKANIPKSSGYKIINSLINDGFLVIGEKIKNPDGNLVSSYSSTISSVNIKIKNSIIEIEIEFPKSSITKSHILSLSLGRKKL